jgi:hypothetical protein
VVDDNERLKQVRMHYYLVYILYNTRSNLLKKQLCSQQAQHHCTELLEVQPQTADSIETARVFAKGKLLTSALHRLIYNFILLAHA